MKKTLLFIFFISIGLSAHSQSLQKLDSKNGFKDLIFGLPYDSLKRFLSVSPMEDYPNKKVTYYKVADSTYYKVGGAELSSITVGFFDNKLFTISIKTKGYSNSRNFLSILQSGYGKGYQDNRYLEEYGWFGERVSLSYDENSATNDAKVFLFSVPINKERKTFSDNLANKASGDL